MLTGLQLRTLVGQGFVRVLENMSGILAVTPIQGKIRRHVLGFGGATGVNDVGFAVFYDNAVSHSSVSSEMRDRRAGEPLER
jgi:hypothetical protein